MRAGAARPIQPVRSMRAGAARPIQPVRWLRTPGLPTAELLANYLGAGDQRLELGERKVPRQPREAAVRVDPQFLGLHALEDPANPARDQLGALDIEVLQIEDARAQLLAAVEFAPEVALGHLAIGELEDELIGRGARDHREQGPVCPLAEAEPFERPEADGPDATVHRHALEA